ncbi:hypothetical protein [Nostoc sp. FACHB-110]|uniref:hypothetical protein n=1 Tax=Nostoc sp. FACHB-110 TaxID=2692834 RepID=UPI0016832FC9|nr:hypothetical protein [Nostoc sp. FACHB-110]MBD2437732.1 hypothetical protein [Nostoc sp. FACHB-110]
MSPIEGFILAKKFKLPMIEGNCFVVNCYGDFDEKTLVVTFFNIKNQLLSLR